MRFLEFAPEIRDTIFEAIAVVTTVESIGHISNRLSCNTFKILHFPVKMWHLKEMKEKVLHMSIYRILHCNGKESIAHVVVFLRLKASQHGP